ncbi:MAG: T9SS type A sorting domain-containing protein [Bacteroidetes bacterium]|nr:T9SS type A sorting domain-containing protein [Bacteroidota bacterium]
MKKTILILAVFLFMKTVSAQNELYSNGTTLQINPSCIVQVNGAMVIKTGSTLTNNGTITVTGNMTNEVAGAFNSGTLEFKGSTAQTLSGTATYSAKNVLINNAAGVTLNTRLSVDGVCTFTNGIVTASTPATPLLFTATGFHTGAADASHVNGYVVKEGTGTFTYPVGNGIRYQKTDVNLTANGTGMQVRYNAGNAGTGTFTAGGSEPTQLVSYNTNEYWDITPLSSATGTVTIFWDGYRDSYPNMLSNRKVAHKTGGTWLNEGTAATGSIAAGSVTSNSISTWSPFALGSIGTVLPLQWLAMSGAINSNKQAVLCFKVQESNVAGYMIEKSSDGRNFTSIATISSKGNGENAYQFTDAVALIGKQYYRIRQTDQDGRYSYSSIITLSNQHIITLAVYPNPAHDLLTISGAIAGTQITLTDISGRVLQQMNVTQQVFTLDISRYSNGVYLLTTSDGMRQRIVKE